VVELQVHGDRGHALRARRLDVVDAVRARQHALDRAGDEAAHEVGVRADVDRGHRDHRHVGARELPHGQRADRLEPGDQDDAVDADREAGPLDDELGDAHQLPAGLGDVLSDGVTALFTLTAAFGRSLNTPDVATSSPGFTPSRIATWSPSARPSFTNCWRTPR